MTTRLFAILFFGILFWVIFDFIFYTGLMTNYIELYDIPIFFNEFFVDTQYWWLWIIGIVLYGTLFFVKNKKSEKLRFYFLSLMIASLPWIPTFGEKIGYALFAKENVDYRFDGTMIHGAVRLYSGRGYDYVKIPGQHEQRTIRYPVENRLTQ